MENEVTYQKNQIIFDSVPYTCPVCFGRGIVDNGFYNCIGQYGISTSTSPETCRSCGGTGIVWGKILRDEG